MMAFGICFAGNDRAVCRWGQKRMRYGWGCTRGSGAWDENSQEGGREWSRVQWFWHFFRNTICFLCFWFGLDILRLVYKKVLFEILNGFYLILPLSFEKSSAAPYRGWKKAEFCADFKNVQKSRVWQKRKNFLQKNWFFGTWNILQKIVFLRKNLWQLLGARVLHIFEISAKFRFFWYPAHPISKKFFSTLIRDSAVFLKVKSSNKIETDQYFKKRFFIN